MLWRRELVLNTGFIPQQRKRNSKRTLSRYDKEQPQGAVSRRLRADDVAHARDATVHRLGAVRSVLPPSSSSSPFGAASGYRCFNVPGSTFDASMNASTSSRLSRMTRPNLYAVSSPASISRYSVRFVIPRYAAAALLLIQCGASLMEGSVDRETPRLVRVGTFLVGCRPAPSLTGPGHGRD